MHKGYIHNTISDTCFRLVTETKSREEAQQHCASEGGYLLTFPTAEASTWFRAKATELAQSDNSGKSYMFLGVS